MESLMYDFFSNGASIATSSESAHSSYDFMADWQPGGQDVNATVRSNEYLSDWN